MLRARRLPHHRRAGRHRPLARGLPRPRGARARLILTGRSAPTDEQRARLLALDQAGAEVVALRADVADASQMRAAAREAIDRFGALHGVIHAAGVAAGGLIDRLTADALDAELSPRRSARWRSTRSPAP